VSRRDKPLAWLHGEIKTPPFSPPARLEVGLSVSEEAYIQLRLRLAEGLKARRQAHGMTQTAMARSIKSSQSRVAKMKAGDPTVSLDLLFRSLLALGMSGRELAAIIARQG